MNGFRKNMIKKEAPASVIEATRENMNKGGLELRRAFIKAVCDNFEDCSEELKSAVASYCGGGWEYARPDALEAGRVAGWIPDADWDRWTAYKRADGADSTTSGSLKEPGALDALAGRLDRDGIGSKNVKRARIQEDLNEIRRNLRDIYSLLEWYRKEEPEDEPTIDAFRVCFGLTFPREIYEAEKAAGVFGEPD